MDRSQPLTRVIDALDVETFLCAADEEEARSLAVALLRRFGLSDVDVVFCEHRGPGARVRVRGYVYRPTSERQAWQAWQASRGDAGIGTGGAGGNTP